MVADCFEENTATSGNLDITGVRATSSYHPIASADDCQEKCQSVSECKYFVFREESKTCLLKKEEAINNKRTIQNMIFGPKYCGTGNAGSLFPNVLPEYCTRTLHMKINDSIYLA